jgi:hypothetical protein
MLQVTSRNILLLLLLSVAACCETVLLVHHLHWLQRQPLQQTVA